MSVRSIEEMRASRQILRRVLSIDSQIRKAKSDHNSEKVSRLEGIRQAYVVDLMDVLNQEEVHMHRRESDERSSYDLPATEKWIKKNAS